MAIDSAVQQALQGGHLPSPTDQIRLCMPDSAMPFSHTQQPVGGDWFVCPFDQNMLRLMESGTVFRRRGMGGTRPRRRKESIGGQNSGIHRPKNQKPKPPKAGLKTGTAV